MLQGLALLFSCINSSNATVIYGVILNYSTNGDDKSANDYKTIRQKFQYNNDDDVHIDWIDDNDETIKNVSINLLILVFVYTLTMLYRLWPLILLSAMITIMWILS
jgi:hypothetical protein